MSENSNQTDNSAIESDDFPSDYIEYYYRCRISNIESGAEDFYYVINTILYNWRKIVKFEDDNQRDCSRYSFIKQLIRYNNDFYEISQKIIDKSGIDTLEDYRKNFNLLVRIVNETMMFLSEYYVYIDKKIGNTKFINKSDCEIKEYIDYNISQMPLQESNDSEKKLKKIKFKKLVEKICGVSGIINPNSTEIIIGNYMFLPMALFMLLLFIFLLVVMVIIIKNIILYFYEVNASFSEKILVIFELLACIIIMILFFKVVSPIDNHIERRKRSYKQSENFIISPLDKKKVKIKWSEIWSLIREIISASLGSGN